MERYLPGLSRSDLLRGLSRLEALGDLSAESPAVRYLGSTIVLQDEACFCQFEAPSETAVADANRQVGLSFDRIVPALVVATHEGRSVMSAQTRIEAPVRQMRRWLLAGAAVLAAGAIGAVLAFAVGVGDKSGPNGPASVAIPASPSAQSVIMSLTPRQLAGGALGLSYALPTAQRGPTMASVLASMSPQTRRYTEAVLSLTFAQLAAGAAGSP